jgi:hypothetical protein
VTCARAVSVVGLAQPVVVEVRIGIGIALEVVAAPRESGSRIPGCEVLTWSGHLPHDSGIEPI